MKTLIAYNVHSTAVDRFRYVQQLQAKNYSGIDQYDRLIVSDQDIYMLGFTSVKCERFGQVDRLCVAAARNAAIVYADQHGYDAVVLFDIDHVLVEPIKDIKGDYAVVLVYSGLPGEIEFGDINGRADHPPVFLMTRSVFYLRFCEEYVGFGCEDVDFNILGLQKQKAKEDILNRTNAIHVWHEKRNNRHDLALENKFRLAQRLANYYFDGWSDMRSWSHGDLELVGMVGAFNYVNHIDGIGETGKAQQRREREGFFDKYCNGHGIDIGCNVYPTFPNVDRWDWEQGDATFMAGVADNKYDFVYSSHCLEDSLDPITSLRNWYRILKPLGYLIVAVPHRDLFEKKRQLPSLFNPGGHKTFWVVGNNEEPPTLGMVQTLLEALPTCRLESVRITDERYYPGMKPESPASGEYSIEAVVRKMP